MPRTSQCPVTCNIGRLSRLEELKGHLEQGSGVPSLTSQKKPGAATPPPTPYGTPCIQTSHLADCVASKVEKLTF